MKRKDVAHIPKIFDEPRGTNDKYWVNDNGINKLVKYNSEIYKDLDVMESLASTILKKIGIDCVNVTLGYNSINGKNCCLIDSFLNEAEVLHELDINWSNRQVTDINSDISMSFGKVFGIFYKLNGISEQELNALIKQYIRKTLGDCIIGNEDGKLKNTGLIFNEKTLKYRLTPSFDNGLAFHNYIFEKDFKAVCYIGNQCFEAVDVLSYILNFAYDKVSDIVDNSQTLINDDYLEIINMYNSELEPKKYDYIISYLTTINKVINSILAKENKIR